MQKETTSDKVKTMPLPRNWPETSSSKALWAETIVTPGSSILSHRTCACTEDGHILGNHPGTGRLFHCSSWIVPKMHNGSLPANQSQQPIKLRGSLIFTHMRPLSRDAMLIIPVCCE